MRYGDALSHVTRAYPESWNCLSLDEKNEFLSLIANQVERS